MAYKILLVDDEIDILDMLGEFLHENGYEVDTAGNGVEALERLEKQQYNLLLSDINMPLMRGFKLLHIAGEKYPDMKSALMTAYNVNDYIRLARDENISNIIVKTSPFNFDEMLLTVNNLITEEVFGIEKYLDDNAEIRRMEIKHSTDIDVIAEDAYEFLGKKPTAMKLNIAFREIVTNAVYYGARNEKGDQKELWDVDVQLKPDEYVTVCFGRDKEKYAISVEDRKGRLTKQHVLYWLDRNIEKAQDGKPVNIYDTHGRGLFISRETVDRFIINIKRQIRTEIIAVNFLEAKYKGYRPLTINEF